GDAFIALPGGLGTFEEFFEIICGKQLEYHNKAIVLINVEGYYQPLLNLIDQAIDLNFIKPRARDLYFVARGVNEAMEYLNRYVPPAPSDRSFEACAPPSSTE